MCLVFGREGSLFLGRRCRGCPGCVVGDPWDMHPALLWQGAWTAPYFSVTFAHQHRSPQLQAMKPRLLAELLLTRRLLPRAVSPFVGWQCAECRSRGCAQRGYSTPSLSRLEKPYYITTPIFYVNAGEKMKDVFLLIWLMHF